MAKVFVEKEGNTRLRVTNTTSSEIAKDDFVIIGSISGVALEDIPVGRVGAIHCEEGLVVQVGIADFQVSTDFSDANDHVYFDPTAGSGGKFVGTSSVTAKLVGQVIEPQTSGVMRFAKYFKAD